VCLREEPGFRQTQKFNFFFFFREMVWRMLVDVKSGMWCRVLVSRYGELMGRVQQGGRGVSSWWKEIARLRDGSGEGEERGWFAEGVERRVGDGATTFFWSDPWLGGVPFCDRFKRLFNLSLHQSRTVAEMSELG
jgi:hypothetical protein